MHSNGGAKILGSDSHVSHDTFADKDSVIQESKIHSSSLIKSEVKNSTLSHASIKNSDIKNSFVCEAEISYCVIASSIITSLNGFKPQLGRIMLNGVVVEGNCQLSGTWELNGIARIHEGSWHRSPRFIEVFGDSAVEGQELRVGITECIDGKALIACRCATIDTWLRAGPRYGKRLGWTDGQIQQAYVFIEELRKEGNSRGRVGG